MRSNGFLVLLTAALLAGCVAAPAGPVFGDWQGSPPGPDSSTPETVHLVLDGSPDARSGRYHLSTTVRSTFIGAGGGGTTDWSGIWTRQQETAHGQTRTIITLHDALASDIDQYLLAPDGTLQPVSNTRPFSKQDVALYTLYPLARGSRNYGQD